MKRIGIFFILLNLVVLFICSGLSIAAEGEKTDFKTEQEKVVMEWRKGRDEFFKTHQRSPFNAEEKKAFKGLKYYKFNPNYSFSGEIKRFILHINNPDYYATFLTNKGMNKRYIRYGTFRFQLNGKEHTLQIFKSILSDTLFIPFKDKTNGKETYEGGRYIDAEILPGYKIVLDFNMAYQPLCAYNEKFICVLPPRENMMEIPIPAGERNYK
jgi:uncharacterized protein (DUF1684 family)